MFFKGFHRSETFERQWLRLEQLELWRELAIRPENREACYEEDRDLFDKMKMKKKGRSDSDNESVSSASSCSSDEFVDDQTSDDSRIVRQFSGIVDESVRQFRNRRRIRPMIQKV